jgi:hypothetical protein
MFDFLRNFFSAPVKFKEPKEWDADYHGGLLTTLSHEFSDIISAKTGINVHLDEGYSIFYEGLGDQEPRLERLKAINETDINRLTKTANNFLESNQVTTDHIREIVKNVIWHWTPKSEEDDA